MAGSLAAALARRARENGHGVEWTWPSTQYQTDPVAFAREVCGFEPYERQIEIMQAVAVPLARVAVKSGHKTGKSECAALIALWFYCSYPAARVVMSSTTARQVDKILWRALRMLHWRAKAGIRPDDRALRRNPALKTRDIGGEPKILARSGLVSDDFREITGFTAKEAEAVAGVSGENLLYIVDEASGVPETIFEAIQGNMAGGARILLISNPTKSEGTFFECFGAKARSETNPTGYVTFTIRSTETPNCEAGETLIPGLATREWVDMMRTDYGEDSPWYTVRVLGDFVLNEAGKIIGLADILAAEQRWDDLEDVGLLHIGLDPAGPGGGGDETVFCLRRGQRVERFLAFRSQNEDDITVQLVGLVRENARPRERPIVKVDREGLVGSKVFGCIRAFLDAQSDAGRPFDLVGVRASDKARRDPINFDRVRDELWENMRMWIHNGGAIPQDTKLEQELHCPDWEVRLDLKRKCEQKENLRKRLGRSPDRADAMALAVWDISIADLSSLSVVRSETHDQWQNSANPSMDPYDAERAWRR